MKKTLIISALVVALLVAIYFLVVKPLGVFDDTEKKVQAQILELKKKPNWGENNHGFTNEQMVRRTAIRDLLYSKSLSLSDLTSATRDYIQLKANEVANNPEWYAQVSAQAEEKGVSIEEQTLSSAIWVTWNSVQEFEVK